MAVGEHLGHPVATAELLDQTSDRLAATVGLVTEQERHAAPTLEEPRSLNNWRNGRHRHRSGLHYTGEPCSANTEG